MNRTGHPYAVENVIIQSKELQGMENVILYDVPGFDSPTKLHKKQTEDMLKQADAIILVTNVGTNPSLTGTQIDMLRKGRDEDDVKLSAKAFVFGNKLDLAKTKDVANDNEATLRRESIHKYQISTDGRVLAGSAKAYLLKNGIFSKDDRERGIGDTQDKLKEWGRDDGIDTLKTRMKEYYANDRYDILKERAEKTLECTEKYLNEILEKYGPEKLEEIDNAGGKLVGESIFALQTFCEEANVITTKHIDFIKNERPFTSIIEQEIENIFPEMEESSPQLRKIELSGVVFDSKLYPHTRVDSELRETLKTEFLKNIVEVAARRIEAERQSVRKELVDAMLRILGMKENSTYSSELEKSLNELFDRLLVENGEQCRFNVLVERFIHSLIQAVITCPIGSTTRFDQVTMPEYMPEFISLAAYYQDPNVSQSLNIDSEKTIRENERRIFAQILAHEFLNDNNNLNLESKNPEGRNKDTLTQFFNEHKDLINLGAQIAISALPIGKWAKLLFKSGIELKNIGDLSKWQKMFSDNSFQNKWKNYDKNRKEKLLEELVDKFCKKNLPLTPNSASSSDTPEEQTFSDFLQSMREIGERRSIKSKEDMLNALNTDIQILRDITLHSVLHAIGLEGAYSNIIDKNVELIRAGVKKEQDLMLDWINKNIRKIRESEYAVMVNEQANARTRKEIVEQIRSVLNSMSSI